MISGYILVDTPNTFNCDYITTSSECEAAARSLGLSDTSAIPSPVGSSDSVNNPPYCYIENDHLKFNGDGSNTGECGEAYNGIHLYHDKCLCKSTSTPIDNVGGEKPVPPAFTSGVSGCYEKANPGNDWHHVQISWNEAEGAFTWTNRAGTSWSMTMILDGSGWSTANLAVGPDCPYFGDGYEFAALEWQGDPSASELSTIGGPSSDLYHRVTCPRGKEWVTLTPSSVFYQLVSASTAFTAPYGDTSWYACE